MAFLAFLGALSSERVKLAAATPRSARAAARLAPDLASVGFCLEGLALAAAFLESSVLAAAFLYCGLYSFFAAGAALAEVQEHNARHVM